MSKEYCCAPNRIQLLVSFSRVFKHKLHLIFIYWFIHWMALRARAVLPSPISNKCIAYFIKPKEQQQQQQQRRKYKQKAIATSLVHGF